MLLRRGSGLTLVAPRHLGLSVAFGANADCYSFIAVDLHHLLFAGFYRRTVFLEFRTKSQDRLSDNGPVRIRGPTAAHGALRNSRDAAQFPEPGDKLPIRSQRWPGRI